LTTSADEAWLRSGYLTSPKFVMSTFSR
jgi:hypothetical protein